MNTSPSKKRLISQFVLGILITCLIIGLPACKGDDDNPEPKDKKITTVVSGKITGPDDVAIADAEVSAESQKIKTKTDGTYELSISHSGSFTLAVTKEGYLPSESSDLKVKTTAKTHTKNIELSYAYTKKVNGTVKNVAGTPIKGVKISVCLSAGNCEDEEVTTEADGSYELSVKHAGSFTLTATKPGYTGKVVVNTDADTHQSDLVKDIELNFDYKTFFNGALKGRSLESFIHEADPAARVALNGTSSKKINIVLYGHGGPVFEPVQVESLLRISNELPPNTNYARVIVLQEQVIRRTNNTLNTNKVATAKEAHEINQYSVAILYALAAEFVQRGHKVSLLTHSWGSFLAPEMLRQHGDAPFRKILISAGRLDMEEKVYTNFFKGIGANFEFDNATPPNFTIKLANLNYKDEVEKEIKKAGFCNSDDLLLIEEICVDDKVDRAKATRHINTHMTAMRLQSDLGKNRYTKLLENKFAKVIYYFGGKDAAVGRLTVEEVNALTGKSTGYQPDNSRDETIVNFLSEDPDTGKPVITPEKTLKVHTIKGITGRATVKYSMEDDHDIRFLAKDIRSDIIASFAHE